eukprot:2422079-Prymnesium_polylepis.2
MLAFTFERAPHVMFRIRLATLFPRFCSPAGHYCPRGTSRPIPCPAGFFQAESGTAECRECKAGQHSTPGAKECTICATGYYSRHTDSAAEHFDLLATECTACSEIPGATSAIRWQLRRHFVAKRVETGAAVLVDWWLETTEKAIAITRPMATTEALDASCARDPCTP